MVRVPLVAALVMLGCGPAKMPEHPPSAADLVAAVRGHQEHVRTRRAEARVEWWEKGDRRKGRLSMWVAREGRLRLEVDSQVGPISALVIAGPTFQLLDMREDKYFTGDVVPCNVERVLHVALPPNDVIAALLGDAPLRAHERAEVTWNGDAKRWVLQLSLAGGGRERIELAGARLDVARAEELDASGRRLWWLEHDDFKMEQGVAMPTRSRFQQGAEGAEDVILRIKSQQVNLEPPAQAWVLEAPPGLVQQELKCDH
jgi:hypothetical protein